MPQAGCLQTQKQNMKLVSASQSSTEAIEPGDGMHTRPFWKIAIPVSFLLLVPCFWQSRIESVDLSSHIYNTWLAWLIAQKQAPGLWIAHQWSNVLFDLMLAWLFPLFGAAASQKIAVGISVLIFSWGAILLISHGRRPRNWAFLLPSVAVLSYGFIFYAGFFNFYFGMGICFWYLAFFLSGKWLIRCLVTPLLLLAWIAHPLPVVWAVGLGVYTAVAESVPARGRVIALGLGVVALLEGHFLVVSRYQCFWSVNQARFVTGAEQLLLFDTIQAWFTIGAKELLLAGMYEIPYWLLLAAWGMLFWRRAKACPWRDVVLDMSFQLWLLTAAAVVMIPSVIMLPYGVPFSFVSARLSLAAGIMLCAFLVDVQPKVYEGVILALSAFIFFGLVFRDAKELNRIEDRLDAALVEIPPNSRVVSLLRSPSSTRLGLSPHAVDRACIGRCYSYANYEPSSQQFRVRAAAGNSIVMDDLENVAAVSMGQYRVQARDLPVFLVYSCGSDSQQFCSRELHEGEIIDTEAFP